MMSVFYFIGTSNTVLLQIELEGEHVISGPLHFPSLLDKDVAESLEIVGALPQHKQLGNQQQVERPHIHAFPKILVDSHA